jgi:hypothetical protein
MAKLTLSVDDELVSRAKRYATRNKVSISGMVEMYLSVVVQEPPAAKLPPVLKSVRGVLKSANPDHYKSHLVKKYLS